MNIHSADTFVSTALSNERAITCEGLDILLSGGYELLNSLKVMSHDLALLKAGKRLVFALDFSEIHTFLWPEKSRSFSRQVTRALLLSKDIEFTLPPATTVEFIRHLRHLNISNVHIQKRIDTLINNPIVSAFLKSIESSVHNLGEIVFGAALSKIRMELDELSKLNHFLGRLSYLNNASNILSFDSFFNESEPPLKPDLNIFSQCTLSLDLRRPGQVDQGNLIDAHNYSLIWSLSNSHVYKHDTLYFFVTSSPLPYRTFRHILWKTSHRIVGTHHPTLSLVRHPIHVFYLSELLKEGGEGRKVIYNMIQGLSSMLRHLENIPNYQRFLKRKEKPTSIVRLPRNEQFVNSLLKFRARYERLFSPVRDAIESDFIAEENVRKERGVGNWAVGARVSGMSEALHEFPSTRLVYSLFDRLTKETMTTIKRFKSDLKGLPAEIIADVDTEGVIFRSHRLKLDSNENSEFNCNEVLVRFIDSEKFYCSADLYEDYFSLWWTAGCTFGEFLKAVRFFLVAMRNHNKKNPISIMRKKQFSGIYFYVAGADNPVVLSLEKFSDLNIDELLENISGGPIQMVRIATKFGDICYDFNAFRGLPQRAGIISHVFIEQPLIMFLHNTNLAQAPLRDVRRIIRRCSDIFQGNKNVKAKVQTSAR